MEAGSKLPWLEGKGGRSKIEADITRKGKQTGADAHLGL